MGKGARVRDGRLNGEVSRLTAQKEELIRQVAAHELNAERANMVIGCLVKRLGAVLADRRGWRVIVTDEEVEALDGTLEAKRSFEAAGIILSLYKNKTEEVKSE